MTLRTGYAAARPLSHKMSFGVEGRWARAVEQAKKQPAPKSTEVEVGHPKTLAEALFDIERLAAAKGSR